MAKEDGIYARLVKIQTELTHPHEEDQQVR
jgi:hypothetical protein